MSKSGYIGRKPDDSSVVIARQQYSNTGVVTTFTFAAGYTPGYIDAYINGVRQLEGEDYYATDGTTLTFNDATQTADAIELVAYKAYDVVAPSSVGNFTVGGNLTVTQKATISGAGTTIESTGDVGIGGSVLSDVTVVGNARVVGTLTGNQALVADGNINVGGIGTIGSVTVNSGAIAGVSTIGITSSFASLPATEPTFRNLIINGASQVNQRWGFYKTDIVDVDGAAANSGVSTNSNAFITDRWCLQSDTAASVIGIGSTANGMKQFPNSTWSQVETVSSATNSYIQFYQGIEGFNLVNSSWEYDNPNSKLIVSFYSRSSIACTFYSTLSTNSTGAARRTYTSPAHVQAADTWTRHSYIVPGSTTITSAGVPNDQNFGLKLIIRPHMGSSFTDNGVTVETWNQHNNSTIAPNYVQDMRNTAGATFAFTGCQIEVAQPGQTQPSTYEHLPYDVELMRCKRYYQKFAWAAYTGVPTVLRNNGSNVAEGAQVLGVPMRPTPTGTWLGIPGNSGALWDLTASPPVAQSLSAISITAGDTGDQQTVMQSCTVYDFKITGGSAATNDPVVWTLSGGSQDNRWELESEY